MAEPLKNAYNSSFFTSFNDAVASVIPNFNSELFLSQVKAGDWPELELKQRMRRISNTLRAHLHKDVKESFKQVVKLVKALENDSASEFRYEIMFIPDYVEVYGREHTGASLMAFTNITQLVTCEFAVRPFIISQPELMYKQMMQWATHKHKMVRRLASEGFRPRLPWGMALPALKKDPSPLLEMLDLLRNDEAETVRLSVANNLNDISKDNPELVLKLATKWKGQSKKCDWLLKHGCRTLLKQGNQEAMEIFGLGYDKRITPKDLIISKTQIKVGDSLEFSFTLSNQSSSYTLIRLEYAIYYQKANKTLSKKVYKISEKKHPGNTQTRINRKQKFTPISTRVFHPGLHQLALIINGKEFEKREFNLGGD